MVGAVKPITRRLYGTTEPNSLAVLGGDLSKRFVSKDYV